MVAAASACVALPAVLGYTGASRPSKLCLGLVRGHTGHGHTVCSYTAQYLATLLLLWSLETVLLLIFPVTSVKTFLATAAETALQWSLNYYR